MFAFSHKAVIMPTSVTLSVNVPKAVLPASKESKKYPEIVNVSVPSLTPPKALAKLTKVAGKSPPN